MQAEARRTGREESEGGSGGCEARRKETTRRSSRARRWKAGWMAMISGWPLPEAIRARAWIQGRTTLRSSPAAKLLHIETMAAMRHARPAMSENARCQIPRRRRVQQPA